MPDGVSFDIHMSIMNIDLLSAGTVTYSHLGFIGGRLGAPELLLILIVILLLFGAKRLPSLARALGKSLSEFKKGKAEESDNENQPSSN